VVKNACAVIEMPGMEIFLAEMMYEETEMMIYWPKDLGLFYQCYPKKYVVHEV
jgi:hypothetical protein